MSFNWILFSRLSIIGSKAFTCQIILLIFIKANFIGELFWTTLLYRIFCYLLELREHSAPLPPLVPPQPYKARNTALEGLPKEQKYTLFIHRSIMTMTAYVLFVCLLAVCFFVCSFVFKLACLLFQCIVFCSLFDVCLFCLFVRYQPHRLGWPEPGRRRTWPRKLRWWWSLPSWGPASAEVLGCRFSPEFSPILDDPVIKKLNEITFSISRFKFKIS